MSQENVRQGRQVSQKFLAGVGRCFKTSRQVFLASMVWHLPAFVQGRGGPGTRYSRSGASGRIHKFEFGARIRLTSLEAPGVLWIREFEFEV